MSEKLVVSLLMSMLLLSVASGAHAKKCSRLVTAQMRANALANVEKFEWAASTQKSAITGAQAWVELSDDELWGMITSQELPRADITNKGVLYEGKKPGCPNCGEAALKYGMRWWKYDPINAPWKAKCPNCGEVYPKNDFLAFYKTALDEHGMFRRELGDRSLLFNAEHPDPKDPLHKVYVDDGYGMVDEKGNTHHIIAAYCQWSRWPRIYRALGALARAYTLTGDKQYAHKAAVLLDRIADVYPEMDYKPLHDLGFQHSQGGTGQGRIEGCIWETRVGQRFARAYDLIYDGIQDDDELVKFCAGKAKQYKLDDKSSAASICKHIEDDLLVEILESCKDGHIRGNTGMTHTSLATTAIALDREEVTEEWLDWLFDPDYPGEYNRHKDPIPWVLVEGLDRDGMGGECGGYGLIWTSSFIALAEILAEYPEYTNHDMVAEFPKLKQTFFIEPRLNCLDAVMPNIGDSGATGTWGRRGRASTYMRGYKLYRDPKLANLAWREHSEHGSSLRLPGDIFAEEPDALINETKQIAQAEPFKLRCDHLGRYGQAYMQAESAVDGRALWIHYGYRKGHSHADCLNIGLFAKNIAMMPELGYPEYTGSWPKRGAWTSNTISHNTLLVNDTRAGYSPGGKLNLFVVQAPLRVMDVSSKTAYQDLQTYRRTVALVDISQADSYVFDVFRARGGNNHRLSYHGAAETATIEGIALVKQDTGTFAGPDVEFATLAGEQAGFYKTSGFTYLYDVERSADPVDTYYSVDWKCEDLRGRIKAGKEPHLRLHSLSACDEVALCSGDPPQNKKGNPRRLRYLIQSRLGDNMESQFVTVLEPYDTTPFIKQVRKLQVEHNADPNSVAAVAVELLDGTTDILISCEERTKVNVEGGIEFDGQFGMIRLVDGEVKLMRMSNATLLSCGEVKLVGDRAAYEGTVTKIDASDPQNNLVFLDPPLPQDVELVGQTIHFKNDLPLDTSYGIKAVTEEGISTGDITIIQGFKDASDFAAGYKYLVNVGDEYAVPCCVGLDR